MLHCPEAESGRARAVVAALRGQRCLCVMLICDVAVAVVRMMAAAVVE